MANRFWEHIKTLVDGQTARTDPVNAHLYAIDGGFGKVAAELNRVFRFTAGTPAEGDFQIPQTPAQRASQLLGFSATGAPQLRSGTFTWRGDHAGATFYNVNDMVRGPAASPFYSSLYTCLAQHTAGVFATDLAAARWQVAVDLTEMNRFIRRFQIVTATPAAPLVPGDDLFVDVTSGPVALTLPAAPLISDQPITICHVAGNIVTSPITVVRNGKLIMSLAEDMVINTPNASLELAFCNDAAGWRLVKGT